MASEAIGLALTFYTETWADITEPSQPKRGMRRVRPGSERSEVQALFSASRRRDQVELARRMKCPPSQVDRLLDITHHSRLDQIEAAFAAIGTRLAIDVLDAA
jgi:antitoxin HicB